MWCIVSNIYLKKITDYKEIFSYNKELPSDWSKVFPKKQPLVVDLGCGAGKFLLESIQREPQNNYIGIETNYKRLVKAMQKYRKHLFDNIFLVQRRVRFLSEIFTANSLKTVFVNFPDPWAKHKQLKHRLLKPDFFSDVYPLLQARGQIHFRTDHENYFNFVKKKLKDNEFFSISACDCVQTPKADNILTEFELLFTKKGFPIYFMDLIKNDKTDF